MYTYHLKSNTRTNCGVTVNKDFVSMNGRKIVMKHITSFGVYYYRPFFLAGIFLLVMGLVALIMGLVKSMIVISIIGGVLELLSIILFCIRRTVLHISTPASTDRTEIIGKKDILHSIAQEIEMFLTAGSLL